MERPHFFVEGIEENMAMLLMGEEGEQKLLLPLAYLPEDIREGDWLCASFERDDEKRTDVRNEIGRLMGDLGDNP